MKEVKVRIIWNEEEDSIQEYIQEKLDEGYSLDKISSFGFAYTTEDRYGADEEITNHAVVLVFLRDKPEKLEMGK